MNETQSPKMDRREELAKILGMSSRSIQVWFQNKRQKIKGGAEQRVYESNNTSVKRLVPRITATPRNRPITSNNFIHAPPNSSSKQVNALVHSKPRAKPTIQRVETINRDPFVSMYNAASSDSPTTTMGPPLNSLFTRADDTSAPSQYASLLSAIRMSFKNPFFVF